MTSYIEKIEVFGDDAEFGDSLPTKQPLKIFGRSPEYKVMRVIAVDTPEVEKMKNFPEVDKYKKFPGEEKVPEEQPVYDDSSSYDEASDVEIDRECEEKEEVDREEKVEVDKTESVFPDVLPAEKPVEGEVKSEEPDALETTVVVPTDEKPATPEPEAEIVEPTPEPIVIKKRQFYDPDVDEMSRSFADSAASVRYNVSLDSKLAGMELFSGSLDEISEKIAFLGNWNESMLDAIYARLDKRVISGYTYSIDATLPDWMIKATPVRNMAGNCLNVWETNESLEYVPDIFNDCYDYSFRKAEDVRQVNKYVSFVGCKMADILPDKPKLRMHLQTYIDNLTKLHEIVVEIDCITKDLPDGGSPALEEDMLEMKAVFDRMRAKMSKIKMSMQCTEYAGYKRIIHEEIDFENLDNVTRRSTLKAHASVVSAVVHYFWDNKPRLASGSRDHTIKLWDLSNNSVTAGLEGHKGVVNSLSLYDVCGRPHLASGSFDHTVKLWDLEKKQCIATLEGHTHYVYALASYSVNGVPHLASACCNGEIKLWNLEKKEFVETLRKSDRPVFALTSYTFEGGQFLASAGYEGTVELWCLETKTKLPVRTLVGHTAAVRSLVSYNEGSKPRIASASNDGTIKTWDASTGKDIKTLTGHGTEIVLTTFTHLGKPALGSGDENGTVKFWNLEAGECIKTYTESGPVKSLVAYLDEQCAHLAVGNESNDGGIDVLCS